MESAPVLARTVPYRTRGFTLIEMVVVIGIISVITVIAITGQSSFNKSLVLSDTAYSVAFSARQAQSYGLGSRKYGSTANPGYGLHFDRSNLSSYIFFSDTVNTLSPFPSTCPTGTAGTPSAKPGNCRYDAADGQVNRYNFSRGYSIQKFCGKTASGLYCSSDSTPLTTLDLVFTRPNTSTTISGIVNGTGSPVTFNCATVTITDQTGTGTRMLRISSLGEITVGLSLSCP